MSRATEPVPRQSSAALKWMLGVGIAAMASIGLVLLFLLTQATNNREMYERNYTSLFVINVVVAALLMLVIAWIALRLARRLRQGRFGSRLLVKLAAVFALSGFAPGVLIYVVSYQFVSRSIESWFDVKVEGALEAGLGLGRATLDTLSNDLLNKTRGSAQQLQDASDLTAGLVLEKIREQLGASDVFLWGGNGQLIGSAGETQLQLSPERPSQQQFRLVRAQRAAVWVEGLDELLPEGGRQGRAKAMVLAPTPRLGALNEQRFLMVTVDLPESLMANAMAVSSAYREYQERALAREGLKRMYIGTLTLSLFLAVFGAVLLAVLLGHQITQPLLLLAEGVRQVAAGDLTPKSILLGKDELGGLTRSFAQMTQQLADARAAVEHSMSEVDAARANLQTILDNLTAGVVVLSQQGVVLSFNPGATRILRVPLAAHEGRSLCDIPGLASFGRSVQAQFEQLAERHEHGLDHWQESFELDPHTHAPPATYQAPGAEKITLIARGALLPDATRLLVFDDISEVVSAQRAQAWGEVARRLAHEIKNPLTPIQLSAERLEMKLAAKLEPAEQAMLAKSVKTIVDQVEAMKRLVNEFRDYARLPAAELTPLDLNELVVEVIHLYAPDGRQVPVRVDLDPRCPPVMADAQQIRQVLHNLLQNAQDATELLPLQGEQRSVLVKTQWLESSRRVRLSVQDQGPGFPDHILKRAFEPYVTTKIKGTGLGLAVVKKIADEHGAKIDLSNRIVKEVVQGAQVSLSFPIG